MRFHIVLLLLLGVFFVNARKLEKEVSSDEIFSAFNMMNEAKLGIHYEDQVKPLPMHFNENGTIFFEFGNETGIVYRGTPLDILSTLKWSPEEAVYLFIDISYPGASILLSRCNGRPINLKASVVHHEIKLSCKLMENVDCMDLHLIRTEGPAHGQITVVNKPRTWFHVHIIAMVLISICIVILLVRRLVYIILRVVFPYHLMYEGQRPDQEYY
ncbi:unnamed protein product [Caenorhabditis nigoni]